MRIFFITIAWCVYQHEAHAEVTPLAFNDRQHAYLQQISEIRMCVDPDWMPYDGIDEQGQHIGIMSDFHKLWSAKIGKPITLIETDSWQQSLEYLQAARCDILSSAQDTPERRSYLQVSEPFIFYPLALATQPDHDFIIDLEQVIDRDFVMVEGYAGIEMLQSAYPEINILTTESPEQGLKLVERGQAYGYIDTVPTINYQMLKHGISHLNISGVFEQNYAMSVGVAIDQPELTQIFNRAILYTTEIERQQILKNWLSVNYQEKFNPQLFWQILLIAFVVMLLLFYRYRVVHSHNRRLQSINTKLEQLSHSDQLTGIANRHSLHQRLTEEMAQAHNGFSLILIDVDHFKQVNDAFGHDVGDRVIQEIANLLVSMVRQNDLVGRWGGEEFLIVCSQTSRDGAKRLAEQVRLQVQQHPFSVQSRITVSIGISEYAPDEAIDSCIKRADDALYQAKHQGRNQIVEAHVHPQKAQ